MNSVSELNELLQAKLRPTDANANLIRPSYVFPHRNEAVVWVGHKQFAGQPSASPREARNSAADAALAVLRGKTEHEIRTLCHLPQRERLEMVDRVRDCLRELKQLSQNQLTGNARKEANKAVGLTYNTIQGLEERLLRLGIEDNA